MTRTGWDRPVVFEEYMDFQWEVENPRGLTFNLWITKVVSLRILLGPKKSHSMEGGDLFINHWAFPRARAALVVASAGSSYEPEPGE